MTRKPFNGTSIITKAGAITVKDMQVGDQRLTNRRGENWYAEVCITRLTEREFYVEETLWDDDGIIVSPDVIYHHD